jgi:predicted transcriptional regulator
MWGDRSSKDKNIEKTVREILKSRARSRIYTFLLKKNGSRTDEIIKGTKLHPSTVRETLSKMYIQDIIFRRKMKNDAIGKNPYLYYPIPPIELLKRYANLTIKNKAENFKPVKINIVEKVNNYES